MSVNCETTSAAPPVSRTLRSNLPSSFSKIRSRATLPARRSAAVASSVSATPRRTQRPCPTAPTTSPETRTRASDTRWTTARTPGARRLAARERVERPPVLPALRPEERREAKVADRLVRAALLLEAAPEGVVCVVVHGLEVDDRPELALGLGETPDPVVGDAERLADGRLSRLAPLRLLEGDGRLGVHPLLHLLAPAAVEVVRLALAHSVPTPKIREVPGDDVLRPREVARAPEGERSAPLPRRDRARER